MKTLTLAVVAVVGMFGLSQNADAQTQQYVLNSTNSTVWEIPEAVINAPGLENAYLVVKPITGGVEPQPFQFTIGMDGVDFESEFYRMIPGHTNQARRFVVNIRDLFPTIHDTKVFSVGLYCPQRCVVTLVQRPAGERFWSGVVYAASFSYDASELSLQDVK